jgi:shikimate kinase
VNIILIGFKSAGKSIVGKLLSKKLNRIFVDVDDKIAEIYNKRNNTSLTTHEIYLKSGEARFRVFEKEAILSLSHLNNAIIATGGGSVLDAENMKIFCENGRFVYLNASQESIKKRIIKDKKHLAENFEQEFSRRQKIYRDIAGFVIDTENTTAEEIVNLIMETCHGE